MADEYARCISKQVVAQLAEREGFQLAHGNALDALADVLNRFIREIGTYAKDYAELQGRTDVNVLDLVCAYNDPLPIQLMAAGHCPSTENDRATLCKCAPPRSSARRDLFTHIPQLRILRSILLLRVNLHMQLVAAAAQVRAT